MNKQQAILELQKIKDYAGRLRFNGYHPDFIELDEDVKEAIDMAIEALHCGARRNNDVHDNKETD